MKSILCRDQRKWSPFMLVFSAMIPAHANMTLFLDDFPTRCHVTLTGHNTYGRIRPRFKFSWVLCKGYCYKWLSHSKKSDGIMTGKKHALCEDMCSAASKTGLPPSHSQIPGSERRQMSLARCKFMYQAFFDKTLFSSSKSCRRLMIMASSNLIVMWSFLSWISL